MAFVLKDRVRETSTSTGTGNFTLAGAVSGYQAFSAVCSTNDTFWYAVVQAGGDWETGLGTYSGANTLTRTLIIESSNSGSVVNFGAGTKDVFIDLPASRLNRTVQQPQARISLTSNVAVPTADQAGASTVYGVPINGGGIPVTSDGTNFYTKYLAAQTSQLLTDTTKSPAAAVANAIYPYWWWEDTGTLRCTRGDYLKLSKTVTMTMANPCVLTMTGANLNLLYNPPFVFTNNGDTLPSAFSFGTTYYVLPVTATTFNLSLTPGGAAISTASQSQSGTHIGVYGDDNGVPDTTLASNGLPLNTALVTNGPAASRAVLAGVVRTDASGLANFTFGTTTAGGGQALLHVDNAFNKEEFRWSVGDNSAAWGYTTAAWRRMNNSSGNSASWVSCKPISVKIERGFHCISNTATLSAYCFIGYGLDAYTSAAIGKATQRQNPAALAQNYYETVIGGFANLQGAHTVYAIELGDGANQFNHAGTAQGAKFEGILWL